MSFKTLGLVGIAAASLTAATILTPAPAEARPGWGGGRYHGGWGGGYRGGWGGYRGGYYRRGGGWGWGAVGAGVALGALAAGAAAAPYYRPYPAYGYGYGGGYGYAPAYYGGGCVWRPRRAWDPYYGWVVQRVRVCY